MPRLFLFNALRDGLKAIAFTAFVFFAAPAVADTSEDMQRLSAQSDRMAISSNDVLLQQAIIEITQATGDENDPLEGMNRVIFDFNEGLQDAVLRPLAEFYNETVPENGRTAISNAFDNVSAPVTFVNDLLQFEFDRALTTFMRFFLNSTIGMAGMADIAEDLGFKKHKEDFGQTLGVWGVGEGFYLILPILGPSSPRDAVGKLFVDSYFDPLGQYLDNVDEDELNLALDGMAGFIEYSNVIDELDQIKKTSVDYYAALRSLYRQRRAAEISNGSDLDLPPIPDLSPDFMSPEFNEDVDPLVDDKPLARLDPLPN